MSFFAAGGGLAVVAGLGLKYIESRCEMDETQDAAPSSTEPQRPSVTTTLVLDSSAPPLDMTTSPAEVIVTGGDGAPLIVSPVGDSGNVPATAEASATAPAIAEEADAGNVDAGTVPDGAATPAIAYPSASQPSAEVAPLGEAGANPSLQPSAGSGASISAGDAGEPRAEEPEDSGTPLQSNSIAAPAQDASAGNAAGPVDSAATATSPEDALTAVVAVTAAAFSVDLSDRFETRRYPDGTIMRTVGALPETSPVSYPEPTAPEVDTPHGLLNAIEEYFTIALRSSRTDGHKLIAQLRAKLTQD